MQWPLSSVGRAPNQLLGWRGTIFVLWLAWLPDASAKKKREAAAVIKGMLRCKFPFWEVLRGREILQREC